MTAETESFIQLTQSDIIGLIGAGATILIGVLTWFVSAAHARKSMQKKSLQYRMRITPLLNKGLFKETDELDIQYKGDVLDELVYLEIDIINNGNVALENPPIKIESRDATYIIPAYIEDIPDGYDGQWEIERVDGETCLIKAEHINPGQIIKARFLMDQMPPEEPMVVCPMPNLNIKRISDIEASPIAAKLLETMYPNLSSAVKLIVK